MKKLAALVLIAFIVAGCSSSIKEPNKQDNISALLQICPDEWIDNQMPCACEAPPCECGGQYFIINGERKEIKNYDLNWIRANCDVQLEVVY